MTIETKADLGQTIPVKLDGGYCLGKLTEIAVRVFNSSPVVTYSVRTKETIEVQTKNGPKEIVDERNTFLTEEEAITSARLYREIKVNNPGISDTDVLWKMSMKGKSK